MTNRFEGKLLQATHLLEVGFIICFLFNMVGLVQFGKQIYDYGLSYEETTIIGGVETTVTHRPVLNMIVVTIIFGGLGCLLLYNDILLKKILYEYEFE
jgi:hypothetical protein